MAEEPWPENPTGHDGEDWRVAVGGHPSLPVLTSIRGIEVHLWLYQVRLNACAAELADREKQLEDVKKDLAAREQALIDLAARYTADTSELQRQLVKGKKYDKKEGGEKEEGGQGSGDGDAATADDHP